MGINRETYGVADLDEFLAEVESSPDYIECGLAIVIMNLIAAAQEEIRICPTSATQALNRAKFLITAKCPLQKAPVAEAA